MQALESIAGKFYDLTGWDINPYSLPTLQLDPRSARGSTFMGCSR